MLGWPVGSQVRRALITGAAGFIGSHLTERLLAERPGSDWHVTGVDNFDPWYDPAVKRANIRGWPLDRFHLIEADITDPAALRKHLAGEYDVVVHLAAKAGVRPSIQDPAAYEEVNTGGTRNVLEVARERGAGQVVFASSSSVYGVNPDVPWREDETALRPISPYACTKASGELMGHVYSHLYGIRFMAMRFFNVYGPRQRPDSAVHKFARLILDGEPVPIYGDGTSRRDYVYVGDIAAGVRAAMDYRETPFEAINLGSSQDISVMEMIRGLEQVLGKPARIEWHPRQPGDVHKTSGDLTKARRLLGHESQTELLEGLRQFASWICK
jgi:UDP-glucuronate 4-epimerase